MIFKVTAIGLTMGLGSGVALKVLPGSADEAVPFSIPSEIAVTPLLPATSAFIAPPHVIVSRLPETIPTTPQKVEGVYSLAAIFGYLSDEKETDDSKDQYTTRPIARPASLAISAYATSKSLRPLGRGDLK